MRRLFSSCSTSTLRICPTCSGLTQMWAHQNCNRHFLRQRETPNVALNDLSGFKPQGDVQCHHERIKSSANQTCRQRIITLKDWSGFNSQNLPNIGWAYATTGKFKSSALQMCRRTYPLIERLFNSPNLSNIAWAYATARESNSQLFRQFTDHILSLKDLKVFNYQNLSNIVWTYATSREKHPWLFRRVADHVIALNDLSGSEPQEMSNIAWAYGTAGESNPQIFKRVAEQIILLRDLRYYSARQPTAGIIRRKKREFSRGTIDGGTIVYKIW